MYYKEYLPSSIFSRHIECFWTLEFMPNDFKGKFEILSPDCTFDIIFSTESLFFKPIQATQWQKIPTGATLMGQRTCSINYKTNRRVKVFGIRFKPFAFVNVIAIPLYKLNDNAFQLKEIFELTKVSQQLICQVLIEKEMMKKIAAAEKLLLNLVQNNLSVDTILREQTNYILDRKGILKINEMYSEFATSKVSLRNHFVKKIGLSPKQVSNIWRLNYFLHLQKNATSGNYTQLGLDAGFYDQAHFIKAFKAFCHYSPLTFFKKDHNLLKISQESIANRFFNVYDPVN